MRIPKTFTLVRNDKRAARYNQKIVHARDRFGRDYGSPMARYGLRSVAVYFDGVRNPLVRLVTVE